MTDKDVHTGDANITEWRSPPGDLSLSCNEVHVWRTSLEKTPFAVKNLKEILSDDELRRADRFYFQKDRDQFIATRGLLRLLLGWYLNIEAQELRFCYGPFGKPALLEEFIKKSLRFNISHSQSLALFAFAQNREIGVDLEFIRSDFSSGDIAEQFFSQQEFDTLNALPENYRQKVFFAWWARKEAYLKARGRGLSGNLNNFDVTQGSGDPAELFEIHRFWTEGVSWSLMDLDVGPGYTAALAVEGHNWQLRSLQCDQFFRRR